MNDFWRFRNRVKNVATDVDSGDAISPTVEIYGSAGLIRTKQAEILKWAESSGQLDALRQIEVTGEKAS